MSEGPELRKLRMRTEAAFWIEGVRVGGVTWGDGAAALSVEARAAEVNKVLDAIERGDYRDVKPTVFRDSSRPRPISEPFPFHNHRTLAEVWASSTKGTTAFRDLCRDLFRKHGVLVVRLQDERLNWADAELAKAMGQRLYGGDGRRA